MKYISKPHFSLALILCAFALIFCESSAHARDANPPEIQALVGVTIPPEIKNVKTLSGVTRAVKVPGKLLGFRRVEGSLLVRAPGSKALAGLPGLDVGFIDKTPIFYLSSMYPDMTTEILDVQTLPKADLEMQLKDGKIVANSNGYRFSEHCSLLNPTGGENDMLWYFGLAKPEKGKTDCTHDSRRVFKVWRVDQHNGKIEEIPSATMQCEYFTMDSCD